MTEKKVPYTDPTSGETRLVSEWAASILMAEEPLTKTEKLSLANIGKELSAEHRAKLSVAKRARGTSEETKSKISASLAGKPRGPYSEDHKAKLSAARRGKKKVFRLDGSFYLIQPVDMAPDALGKLELRPGARGTLVYFETE